MQNKKNIAIFLAGISSENVGGAERFFPQFYDIYNQQNKVCHNLYFITDSRSFNIYKKLRKLNFKENVLIYPNISNRFKKIIENTYILYLILIKRINIIHVGSYSSYFYSKLKFISQLPLFLRPKIVVNIVSAELPYSYFDSDLNQKRGDYEKYFPLFNTIDIDGIYCWNKLFKEVAEKKSIIKSNPYIEYISSRFSNNSDFFCGEPKKNWVLFPHRLVEAKRPDWFLEALNYIRLNNPDIFSNWIFFIIGNGPLEENIKNKILDYNLSDNVYLITNCSDVSGYVNYSKCFVSAQDYDNFPSLSMCEAMVSGNAIIARNVGQTDYFVKDGINGILAKNDSAEGIAHALIYYMKHPELHADMQRESIKMTTEIHTPANFIKQIDKFWEHIMTI